MIVLNKAKELQGVGQAHVLPDLGLDFNTKCTTKYSMHDYTCL